MKELFSLIIFILFGVFSICVTAQTNNSNEQATSQQRAADQRAQEAEKLEQQRQIQSRSQQVRQEIENRQSRENLRVSVRPAGSSPDISLLPPKLTKEQKLKLKPDAQDFKRFEAFLTQPKTGLIKLFPDFGCQQNAAVVRVDDDCLKAIPNSSFYSFRQKKYTNESLADLRFKDGVFISDGLLTQGIMTALGNVPLEQISLSDERLKFLNEYQPEAESRAAKVQSDKIIQGFKVGNYVYRNSWRAFENNTYVIRSIAYRGKIIKSFRGVPFDMLNGDSRKDVIVVFRVVRKDSEGRLTILWKELAQKDSPKIISPERDKTNKQKVIEDWNKN